MTPAIIPPYGKWAPLLPSRPQKYAISMNHERIYKLAADNDNLTLYFNFFVAFRHEKLCDCAGLQMSLLWLYSAK